MERKVLVVLNEQHKVSPQQEQLLNDRFGVNGWSKFPVPANGWNKKDMKEVFENFKRATHITVVFVSPVPLLMSRWAWFVGYLEGRYGYKPNQEMFLFHNDVREKKQLPDGRIISVFSPTGWELVQI